MTARATIKQSDLRRMALVANDQNVSIEIEINGHRVKVMPNIHTGTTQEPMDKRKGIRL